ncbi:hypothetical protein [Evansella clarkii]|uniref:hypothetical protein n=1 Tax=Evansella clarkii TaxID=79879 RepID=UPI000997DF24|nr:hypothetical protein [Evansella clarkii]
MATPAIKPLIETQNPFTAAPPHSYWVFTEKGARIHKTKPGTVVQGNPYLIPSMWVNEGLVVAEELE